MAIENDGTLKYYVQETPNDQRPYFHCILFGAVLFQFVCLILIWYEI